MFKEIENLLTFMSVFSTNQLGSSPKMRDPFMAKALIISRFSLKLAKVTTGSPCKIGNHIVYYFSEDLIVDTTRNSNKAGEKQYILTRE